MYCSNETRMYRMYHFVLPWCSCDPPKARFPRAHPVRSDSATGAAGPALEHPRILVNSTFEHLNPPHPLAHEGVFGNTTLVFDVEESLNPNFSILKSSSTPYLGISPAPRAVDHLAF